MPPAPSDSHVMLGGDSPEACRPFPGTPVLSTAGWDLELLSLVPGPEPQTFQLADVAAPGEGSMQFNF